MTPMKKLTNKKGFTLMEMIIVIAIIVILAAISIPTLTGNLDSAHKAADEANLRAAKSAALVKTMEEGKQDGTYYYDIASGKLEPVTDGFKAPASANGECGIHSTDYIVISIADDAVSDVKWTAGNTCGKASN